MTASDWGVEAVYLESIRDYRNASKFWTKAAQAATSRDSASRYRANASECLCWVKHPPGEE